MWAVVGEREPRQRQGAEQEAEVAQRDVVVPGPVTSGQIIPASHAATTGAP